MPIPEIVWSGGGGYSHSCSGCVQNFYTTIGTVPAGLPTLDAPAMLAVMVDVPGAHSGANHGVEFVLADTTVIALSQLTSAALPGSPTSGAYYFGSVDARFALGGTLRTRAFLVSVVAPVSKAGGAFAALVDLGSNGYSNPQLNVNTLTSSLTTDPLPFSFSVDPAPYLGFSLLGKTAERDVTIGTTPGWADVGNVQANGSTSAIATYTPVEPPQLSGAWAATPTSGALAAAAQIRITYPIGPPPLEHRGHSSAQIVG
jgi:hypothetical protein